MDLSLFQFDYELTFAVVFMNADKTIYGRYGSRSSLEDASADVSISGLAEAMSATLALHTNYPSNRQLLEGKQPVETEFKTPNDFPSLKGKFQEELDYQGAVTRSCMHCHQVRDAQREVFRSAGQPVPDRLMLPNPSPAVLGLRLDPRHRATVSEVTPGSPGATSGLRSGDEILEINGQPIVSQADIEWILHHAASSTNLQIALQRSDERMEVDVDLSDGWRNQTDISWRESSWGLRRQRTGGIRFDLASSDQRSKANVPDGNLALVVKHMGSGRGPHGAAKRAGFQVGDLLVSYNRQTNKMTPSQLLVYAARNTQQGQRVPVTVIRGNERVKLELPIQE